jgi:hypothetical protein
MTYAARPSAFIPCVSQRPVVEGHITERGRRFFHGIVSAVLTLNKKLAEREIASYLEGTGGRFTDGIERRISDRLITGRWHQ